MSDKYYALTHVADNYILSVCLFYLTKQNNKY